MRKKILVVVLCLFSFRLFADLKTETIGALSAANLYLTYQALGAVADGYVKKTYSKKLAILEMQRTVNLSKTSKKYIQKLINSRAISGRDINFANEIILTYNYLINEGVYFIRYMKSPSQTNAKGYNSNRKKAWGKIKRMLKIKSR